MIKKIWSRRTVIVALVALALFAGSFEVRAQKHKQIDVGFEEKLLATIPEEFHALGIPSYLFFSPNCKQVAYVQKGDKEFIVIGDEKGEEFDDVLLPVFSPDGKKVAFGARKGNELWWKVRNVEEE